MLNAAIPLGFLPTLHTSLRGPSEPVMFALGTSSDSARAPVTVPSLSHPSANVPRALACPRLLGLPSAAYRTPAGREVLADTPTIFCPGRALASPPCPWLPSALSLHLPRPRATQRRTQAGHSKQRLGRGHKDLCSRRGSRILHPLSTVIGSPDPAEQSQV